MSFGGSDSPKHDNCELIKENETLLAEVVEIKAKIEAENKQNEQLTNENKNLTEKVTQLEKQIAEANII